MAKLKPEWATAGEMVKDLLLKAEEMDFLMDYYRAPHPLKSSFSQAEHYKGKLMADMEELPSVTDYKSLITHILTLEEMDRTDWFMVLVKSAYQTLVEGLYLPLPPQKEFFEDLGEI